MKRFDPHLLPLPKLHRTLLGAIAPRPIAFVSSVDAKGNHNLSPFSFFNAFGINPTTLIFSPSRRGRDNTVKDTYENVKEVPEVVINVVNYAMVEQMSLASSEYPSEVDEFIKAGFTPLPSETIRPMRVKESPAQFECKVREVIETGDQGGAANLVICEIRMIHLHPDILDTEGEIDPEKIDLVGRLGGDYYCRASGEALFRVAKPGRQPGIGVDILPENVRLSRTLSGNDLGKLGSIDRLPSPLEIKEARQMSEVRDILGAAGLSDKEKETQLHLLARRILDSGEARKALSILLI
jgi:flavin reductase (DIM6/NTAB) family NADH-FMN oxidoreductase RutF